MCLCDSRVSAHNPSLQVATLMCERQRLLLRGRAAQLLLQTSEAAAGLAGALQQKSRGGHLQGAARSRVLAQLQAQVGGLQQELAEVERSAREAASSRGGAGTTAARGAAATSCAAASCSSAGQGDRMNNTAPDAFMPGLLPLPLLCWTLEQALKAADVRQHKCYASLISAFAVQAAPLLR